MTDPALEDRLEKLAELLPNLNTHDPTEGCLAALHAVLDLAAEWRDELSEEQDLQLHLVFCRDGTLRTRPDGSYGRQLVYLADRLAEWVDIRAHAPYYPDSELLCPDEDPDDLAIAGVILLLRYLINVRQALARIANTITELVTP